MAQPTLLFDLDGTISDPLEGIWRCINYGLGSLGYPELVREAVAPFIGPPLDTTFRVITGSEDPEMSAHFVEKFRERFAETGYSENRLYPGIPEAVQMLRKSGFVLGICTSKRADFAETVLKMFGLYDNFQFISGGDIGIPKSRQIESLLTAETIPRSTVMIGDRYIDIAAAHDNGLPAAGVLWGYGSRTELEAESPQYLLSDVSELVEIFCRKHSG